MTSPSLLQVYYGLAINIIFLSIFSSPLDLSFNNIEGIEGLDSLVKLEDLSLYNNRISVIENMDTLLNLHVLSIGNNFLAQLENVSNFHALHTCIVYVSNYECKLSNCIL